MPELGPGHQAVNLSSVASAGRATICFSSRVSKRLLLVQTFSPRAPRQSSQNRRKKERKKMRRINMSRIADPSSTTDNVTRLWSSGYTRLEAAKLGPPRCSLCPPTPSARRSAALQALVLPNYSCAMVARGALHLVQQGNRLSAFWSLGQPPRP
jgi:hypothetical protein